MLILLANLAGGFDQPLDALWTKVQKEYPMIMSFLPTEMLFFICINNDYMHYRINFLQDY